MDGDYKLTKWLKRLRGTWFSLIPIRGERISRLPASSLSPLIYGATDLGPETSWHWEGMFIEWIQLWTW